MALNCKITKSNNAACETSVGGVLRMWVANYSPDYLRRGYGLCKRKPERRC